jgi:hypothetical protein
MPGRPKTLRFFLALSGRYGAARSNESVLARDSVASHGSRSRKGNSAWDDGSGSAENRMRVPSDFAFVIVESPILTEECPCRVWRMASN